MACVSGGCGAHRDNADTTQLAWEVSPEYCYVLHE